MHTKNQFEQINKYMGLCLVPQWPFIDTLIRLIIRNPEYVFINLF